jgi:hypothetical protein|tara:strand:+ start:197 stop:688 length:492 start_codon:yes stop_codon:yes gene_type:complete
VSDDKIIPFPKNRIVNQRSRELDEQRRKMGDKVAKEIEKQQTKQFVETSVDDMSMNLLRQFYDMSIKTDKHTFTKDLALLVDVMRGLMYRDFGVKHPAQSLSDKMVTLKVNRDGTQSAKIDYTGVTDTKVKNGKPLSKDFKEELKDLNETGIKFDPDDDNGIT